MQENGEVKIHKKSSIITWILRIIIILTVIIFLVSIYFSFISYTSDFSVHTDITAEDQKYYASVVLMPDLSDQIERFGIRNMRNLIEKWKRVSIETTKYKNLEELCNALPEGCSDPIRNAIASGQCTYGRDLEKESVKWYTIEQGLPLIGSLNPDPEVQQQRSKITKIYYQVYEYGDGAYRFQVWYEADR